MLELRFENPLCSEMVAILIWYDIREIITKIKMMTEFALDL